MTTEEIDKVIEEAEYRDDHWHESNEDWCDAHRELLVACKQLREERRWMPIETAPKDGRVILLRDDDAHEIIMMSDWWHSYANGDGHWEYAEAMDDFNPTHWMPLPGVPND